MTLTTERSEALIVTHREAHRYQGLMDKVDELVSDEHLNFLPPVKFARDPFIERVGILVFEFTFEENSKSLYLRSL
jgi:hypothetical protein